MHRLFCTLLIGSVSVSLEDDSSVDDTAATTDLFKIVKMIRDAVDALRVFLSVLLFTSYSHVHFDNII